MTAADNMLSEFVEIRTRFLRSVNLERDYTTELPNGDYIITPTARRILRQLVEGLEDRSPYRAWTITGPYGVGKSAFGVFLGRLLCSNGRARRAATRRLEQVDPPLAHEISRLKVLRAGARVIFPILVTARRVPASVCLLDGVVGAARQLKGRAAVRTREKARKLLKAAGNGTVPDSREVLGCITDIAAAAEGSGHKGVLIVIDELGKLFEYAAHSPQKADVFVLQELAEHVSRSGAFPVVVLGILHQSFEEYGRHLDSVSRNEWAKIQGRFQDVAFLEPPEQVLRMVAAAIRWKTGDLPSGLRGAVREIAEQTATCGVCPPGMRKGEFVEICLRAYPLHPSVLVALPHLFHRFAQNERSLFSYLSSHEPKGFQEFLRTRPLSTGDPCFVRLPELFDYFTANFGSGLFRQPHARRWLEAANVLDRKGDLADTQVSLVKTIGILSALGTFCHLSATKAMISFAVADLNSPSAVQDDLKALTDRSILTYRKFNDTYRIWEGSDVDIEERISEGQRRTRADLRLSDAIQRYLPARPIVARRHSFETGALRYFQVRYVDDPTDIPGQLALPLQGSGLILVCLSASGRHLEKFRQQAARGEAAKTNVLFAIPQEIGEIRATVVELAALQWAWDNTPDLRDDRVARRELAMRIADTQQILAKGLGRLLDPREEPEGSRCLWYYQGERKKARRPVHVAHLLSDVCDQLYLQSPRIRNELITRRTLSSAAAAARRKLVERMLTLAEKESLGLEGYPPERSMYESVLKATGLHRQDSAGRWHFAAPSGRDPCNLKPVWQRLCDVVFKAQPEPESLDSVFRAISEPPYGVPDGLHPVLLCAFLGVYADETTLYREGTFVAEPGITEFEVLMRRPELFAVAGCRIKGGRAAVVERIAKGLKAAPATVPVVRALFRLVKGLPEYARSTMKLSGPTLAMRQAFLNAKSPERFLFVGLPEALQVAPFGKKKPHKDHVKAFFSALNRSLQEWTRITPAMIEAARDTLLRECGQPAGMQGWQELREMAHRLEPGLSHPTLFPFVRRAAQAASDQAGVESVLALVANRSPQTWTDGDVERFPASARVIGQVFQEAARSLHFSPTAQLESLKPAERKQAQRIAHDIQQFLQGSDKPAPPRVIEAAFAILSRRMRKEGHET